MIPFIFKTIVTPSKKVSMDVAKKNYHVKPGVPETSYEIKRIDIR